jgi:enoyl-CoA hydratase/carnithine racemase
MKHLQLEMKDSVAWVTFYGRGSLNLIGRVVVDELSAALNEISRDNKARSVVIRGAGQRAFSGGVDLMEMKGFSPQEAEEFITSLHSLMLRIMTMGLPSVACIHGACLGGALELAMACDLRVASDEAMFGLPEVRVGIPSVIEASLLPRIIGWGKASELILTGESVDAKKALQWGLINRVAPKGRLEEEAHQAARQFHSLSPHVLAVQKEIMYHWLNVDHEDAVRFSIKAFALCFTRDDPREAMEAFLEKRRPEFSSDS